jgi:hypothetical protein
MSEKLPLQRGEEVSVSSKFRNSDQTHAFLIARTWIDLAMTSYFQVSFTKYRTLHSARRLITWVNGYKTKISLKSISTNWDLSVKTIQQVLNGSWHSSVGTVTGYVWDHPGMVPRLLAAARDCQLSREVQTGSGAHSTSCRMVSRDPFPGDKAAVVRNWPFTSPHSRRQE